MSHPRHVNNFPSYFLNWYRLIFIRFVNTCTTYIISQRLPIQGLFYNHCFTVWVAQININFLFWVLLVKLKNFFLVQFKVGDRSYNSTQTCVRTHVTHYTPTTTIPEDTTKPVELLMQEEKTCSLLQRDPTEVFI